MAVKELGHPTGVSLWLRLLFVSTLGLSRVSGRSERLCVLYLDEWKDTGRRETHHEVSLLQVGWALQT